MSVVTPSRAFSSRRVVLLLFLAIPLTAYFATQYRLAYLEQQKRIAEWEQEQALERKLETLVEFKFGPKVRLVHWLADWSRQSGIEARLFNMPLSEWEPSEDFDLWLDLPPLSAREALQVLCEQEGGHWCPLSGGVITVALERYHHRKDDTPLEARLHPLSPSLQRVDRDELIALIFHHIAPDSWEDVGGRGKLEFAGGHLAVVQFHDVQRKLAGFLQSLDAALLSSAEHATTPAGASADRNRPRPLGPDAEHLSHLLNLLEQPITLDVVDVPLEEFAARLSHVVRLPVNVDPDLIGTTHPNSGYRVTCQVRDMKLRHALSLALRTTHVEAMPIANGRAIWLTSHQEAMAHRPRCAYCIGDFIQHGDTIDFDPIVDAITSSVSNLQEESGAGEGDCFGPWFIHPVTLEKHGELQDFLTTLRLALSGASGPRYACGYENEASRRMLQVYEQPHQLIYEQKTLGEITVELRSRAALPIYTIDQDLIGAGVDPERRISCHLPARPLRENLTAMLAPLGLAVQVHPEYLLIAWPGDAENVHGPTEIFDFRILRHRWPDFAKELDALVTASDYFLPDTFRGLLLFNPGQVHRVPATDFVHFLWQAALTGESRWPGKGVVNHSQWHRPIHEYDFEAIKHEQIGELLGQRVSVHETNRPMAEILFLLAKEYHLPIAPPVIPQGGIPLDAVISLDCEDQPLKDVLQKLIGHPDVARWQVRQGAISIEDAKAVRDDAAATEIRRSERQTYNPERCYFVADLLAPRGPFTPEQLTGRLTSIKAYRTKRPNDIVEVIDVSAVIYFDALLIIQGTPRQLAQAEQNLRDLRHYPGVAR